MWEMVLTMGEPSVFSLLERSMVLLVNQHLVLPYGCSSAAQASFPLSVECIFGRGCVC